MRNARSVILTAALCYFCIVDSNDEQFLLPIQFEWRTLSEKSLKEWYRPVDLCMMQEHPTATTTQDQKTKICKSDGRAMKQFCGPGHSNRGPCPMPLHSRSYFKKGLIGYDDAKKLPLKKLLYELDNRNAALVFIGDSIMNQNMQAFLCECDRENISLSEHHNDQNCHLIYEVAYSYKEITTQIHLLRLGSLNSIQVCPTNRGKNISGSGTFAYAKTAIASLEEKYSGLLIVANIGVWYNTLPEYLADLPVFLQWLNDLASQTTSNHSVVILESMPQHWDTNNGYHSKEAKNKVILNQTQCCHAIKNKNLEADWRNFLLRSEIKRLSMNELSVLSLRKAFINAQEMHSCDIKSAVASDCTHYCFWPLQNQFIWHSLAIIAGTRCVGKNCVLDRSQ